MSICYGWTNNDKKKSFTALFLQEDFVDAMKRLNPQQLAEFLFKNEVESAGTSCFKKIFYKSDTKAKQ